MNYGARCASISLDEYLGPTPRNATDISKTTQNDIIDICGELMTESITAKIKNAKFFSVLADEATDRSNIEQMSFVIRFVDKKSSVREEFPTFCTL